MLDIQYSICSRHKKKDKRMSENLNMYKMCLGDELHLLADSLPQVAKRPLLLRPPAVGLM